MEHREWYSVLCGDLKGKEIEEKRDIYVCIDDLVCCTAKTNTIL